MLFLKKVENHLRNAPKFIEIRGVLMKFLIFSKIQRLIMLLMLLIMVVELDDLLGEKIILKEKKENSKERLIGILG